MIRQMKITKDKTGRINLEVNNVTADPTHFKAVDDVEAITYAASKYDVTSEDFIDICNTLKHIRQSADGISTNDS